ncbi:hypothetical protein CF8_0086 [Aeromonas phage CF8]|nr:hypothetical protein CF8_0086 [Aeromonas phage CF8]
MKPLKQPIVETRQDVIAEQSAKVESMDTSTKVPTEKVPVTPATIWKNGFNLFVDFLKGDHLSGDLIKRPLFQAEFMDSIPRILELDQNLAHEVLDHWLITIAENRRTFGQNQLFVPLYAVEKDKMRPISEIARYKMFLVFMVMLSDNAQVKSKFIANFDVAKLVHEFSGKAAQTLNNYIYR